jgi:glycerol-3-phosphate dehydrogenase
VNRRQILSEIREKTKQPFDLLIIGGGATGLGIAWDAATRGYRPLLIEQNDFAQGTSSRSTKLIHGGVRYLQQLNLSLVRESLQERGRLLCNAPALVQLREFVIPAYRHWDRAFYGVGLKAYDALAGRLGGKPSRLLSREETLERIPEAQANGLVGGVSYWDGQFDDAGLAIALANEIVQAGGLAINHARLESVNVHHSHIHGATITDSDTGECFEVAAKAIINATGVHSDRIRKMNDPTCVPLIAASRGSHIVLPNTRLNGNAALMIPKTRDGRVLFAIPWLDHLLVGTTDVATEETPAEPTASAAEIRFLLEHINQYLVEPSNPGDILSTFAGLRPLVRAPKAKSTATLSRDHYIEVSPGGLISVVGGKWTTFRKMAEDAVDCAIKVANLPPRNCVTAEQPIPPAGCLSKDHRIDQRLPITRSEIEHAVNSQLALKLDDVLARRTRCLFVNVRATLEIAPKVAEIMAAAMGEDDSWQSSELKDFSQLAQSYLPTPA